MNHAFLIMAYNKPELLARIVNRLKAPNHFMFIHIDAKSNIDAFKEHISDDDHTIYLGGGGNRESVYWGSISQIMTELHLMNVSYSFQTKMDYFHLISGQDYPCKSNLDIDKFFNEHLGESFMDFSPDQKGNSYEGRYRKFYFNDIVYCNNILINTLQLPIKCLQKFHPLRKKLYGIHKGANWFSLHRNVVAYCLNWYNEHPAFLKRMRYTRCMDECFVQTIVWEHIEELHIKNDYLRYIDWTKPRSNGNNPAILDERDYDRILSSNAIFCRKVDGQRSNKLLEMLDNYLDDKQY